MLGENPQHLNKNSAEVSPPPLILEWKKWRGQIFFRRKANIYKTIIIKYFYVGVEYLSLFIFNFLGEECLGTRKSRGRAAFSREGAERPRAPSTSEALRPQVGLRAHDLRF